ncbi:DUF2530 domain-containing protein [Cellulosimicrobium terreum]|nr:DUF2530 domain-containing protein [Cellulosimicrobium terreum]
MSSIVALLLHPELRRPLPAPVRVDLRRVILAGIGAWTAALVVAAVLLATGAVGVRGVATCGAGIVLGLLGLAWERVNRSSYRPGGSGTEG